MCYDDCMGLRLIVWQPHSIMHAAVHFVLSTLTVSAEKVDVSTPGARVTWSIQVPPECVESVRVKFRTISSGSRVVRSYTTTNASQSEVILAGLQCGTTYYIKVVVAGVSSYPYLGILESNEVRVFVGGKVTSEVHIMTMTNIEALLSCLQRVLGGDVWNIVKLDKIC